jgi:hypothetical protein
VATEVVVPPTPQVLQDLDKLIRGFEALREAEAVLIAEAERIQATLDTGDAIRATSRWGFAAQTELESVLRFITRESDCYHCPADPEKELHDARALMEMAFANDGQAS